jgi:hypothetical protein
MTLTQIQALSRYYATGDQSDTSFSDADILMLSNPNYRRMIAVALKAVGDWTLGAEAKAQVNIAAGSRTIAFPAALVRLKSVEIKYPSSAQEYRPARQMPKDFRFPVSEDDYTTGWPMYSLAGSSMKIFLSSKLSDITAVANGVNVYTENDITALATGTDTTILPEFAVTLLSKLNALDYCVANDHAKQNSLRAQIGQTPAEGVQATGEWATFLSFLSNRADDRRPSIGVRREEYGDRGGRGDVTAGASCR